VSFLKEAWEDDGKWARVVRCAIGGGLRGQRLRSTRVWWPIIPNSYKAATLEVRRRGRLWLKVRYGGQGYWHRIWGSTKSGVAIVENGLPVVIPNRGRSTKTYSVDGGGDGRAGNGLSDHIANTPGITTPAHGLCRKRLIRLRKWNCRRSSMMIGVLLCKAGRGPHGTIVRIEVCAVQEVIAAGSLRLRACRR